MRSGSKMGIFVLCQRNGQGPTGREMWSPAA